MAFHTIALHNKQLHHLVKTTPTKMVMSYSDVEYYS